MTIRKYKHCDGCEIRVQLEPILIGSRHEHWIEVRTNATQYDTIFTSTHHFHNQQCLVDFINREDKRLRDLYDIKEKQ